MARGQGRLQLSLVVINGPVAREQGGQPVARGQGGQTVSRGRGAVFRGRGAVPRGQGLLSLWRQN